MTSTFPLRLTALACALASLALPAQAERADREKPVNLESDRVFVDEAKKTHTFEGNVILTQGTLIIKSDKLVVAEDAGGFQKGIATGGPNGLAWFKQKREGKNEYVEGEAERIEHDSKTEKSEFFNKAHVKSGQDDVRGQYIIYDAKSENYTVTNGPNGSVAQGKQERVRAVIQPRGQDK
ncbi:MAG TPA: lipopolysaccharide transport periplasmic protein LptA [Rhodocyclaceae bacterium]|jgi:lipopolysaccharide export system protein LptA